MYIKIDREIADAYSVLTFAEKDFGYALKKLDEVSQFQYADKKSHNWKKYRETNAKFEIAESNLKIAKQRLADVVLKQLKDIPHSEIFPEPPVNHDWLGAYSKQR